MRIRVPLIAAMLGAGVLLAACASTPTGPGGDSTAAGSEGRPGASTSAPSSPSEPSSSEPSSSEPSSATPSSSSAPAPSSTPATTAPAAADPATRVETLRPVTADGRPAAGWSVRSSSDEVLCAFAPHPAPASTGGDVYYCSPSASSSDTCWVSADAGRVLCLTDPFATVLTSYRLDGRPGPIGPAAHPVPLGLVLSDGDHCRLRDGGAWDAPSDHPDWAGMYSCRKDEAVWGPPGSPTAGIDTSGAAWTVTVGAYDHPLYPRTVVRALFVGDAVGA